MTTSSYWPFIDNGGLELDVSHSKGHYLYMQGKKVLDFSGGAVVSNVGWGRSEIPDAMAEALKKLTFALPPMPTDERLKLAKRLIEDWLPQGINRVSFGSGGSETIDTAIRLVHQYHIRRGKPEKWKVIGLSPSYHGNTLSALSAGGHDERRAPFEQHYLYDWPKAGAPNCYRCPLKKCRSSCNAECIEELEQAIIKAGPESVGAIIVEPVIGSSGGAIVIPPDYATGIRSLCDRYDLVFIVDEVMTAFGRTGKKFGVDHWDVVPDVLVGGKGLAGGYAPITVLAAREEITRPLEEHGDMLMFFTQNGNTGCCAAANATLDILEREGLVGRAAEMGAVLDAELRTLEDHPLVGNVRGLGLLYAMEFVADKSNGERFPLETRLTGRVVTRMLEKGVFVYPGGTSSQRDIIAFGPALTIEETEIRFMVEKMRETLDELLEEVR